MKTPLESPATSALVPGALIVHGAIPDDTVMTINRGLDNAIERIASEVGLTTDQVGQLCSAWSDKADFVQNAARSIESYLPSAIATMPDIAHDAYNRMETSLFVASYNRGDSTHAHQDIAYRWNRPQNRYTFTTWLALDHCDVSSGALLFSHTASRDIEIRQDFLCREFIDRATTPAWIKGQVVATVQPGDVVIFDSCVWHASARFSTAGQRRALAVRWTPASGQRHESIIPKPVSEANRFGIDTAGSLLKNAIIQAYPNSPDSLYDNNPQFCVDWLLAQNASSTPSLSAEALKSLRQLARAHYLAVNFGARPASQVWKGIRDIAIPELHALSGEG